MTFLEDPQIITTDEELRTLCEHLRTQTRLAVDLEGDSLHHFKEKLCLLQVSDESADYIVDILTITDFGPMKSLLEDASILKIMHGADYDVVSLKRDYDCSINSLFDTAIAAQFLNYEKWGLAYLIQKHFGFVLEKRYQKHDWSRRPLYWEHIDYARMDTHYLLALHEILKRQLERKGLLDACTEESTCLTQREWNGRQFDEGDFLRVKKVHTLSKESLKVLRTLYEARDAWAQKRDVPVFHYATDAVLFGVAYNLPEDRTSLIEAVHSKYAGLVSKKSADLLKLVAEGKADDRPLPPMASRPKKRQKHRWLNETVNKLREWRTSQHEGGVHLFLLPTNNQIKDLAFDLPKTSEDLAQTNILRQWQIDLWGEAVLNIIQAVVNPPS